MIRSAVLLHVNRRQPLCETHLKDDLLQDTGDGERRDVVVVVGERLLLRWDGPELGVTEGGVRDQDHTLVGGGGVASDRNYLFSHLVHKDLPGEGRGGEGRRGEGRGGEGNPYYLIIFTCTYVRVSNLFLKEYLIIICKTFHQTAAIFLRPFTTQHYATYMYIRMIL